MRPKNMVADHLSRLVNKDKTNQEKEVSEEFSYEQIRMT